MELRQLRYFLTVADLRNFTRAASVVHIAQSALSRQIRKLEDELGAVLLYRNGRTATLTEAGRRFYDHAKLVLRQLDDAKQELSEQEENPTGSVALGYPPHLGPEFPVSIIRRFRSLYPRAQLRIVEGFTNQLADYLFTGRVDVALVYNAPSFKHLASEFTVTESLFLIAPPDDPISTADTVAFASLAELPFITPDPPSATRSCVEEAMARSGVPIRFALEVDSLPAIKRLVSERQGYALLAFSTVYEEVAAGLLSATRVVGPGLEMQLSLARPLYGKSSALTGMLVSLVREEVDRAIQDGLWVARATSIDARHPQAMAPQ
jgi:LysR family nitrogen assimilation transcriptional regulator